MYRSSSLARQILEVAGWYDGRVVDTARWEAELTSEGFQPLHPAARRFLAEFGGLAFRDPDPGIECAREPLALVPTQCAGEADRFIDWGHDLNRQVAPIGQLAGGTHAHAFLGIDEYEEIYLVIDRLATYGRMPRALEDLILGYLPREIG